MLSFFLPNISLRLIWGDLITLPQKVIPDMFMAISLAPNISWFFRCSLGLLLKWTGCQVPEMFIGIALNSPGNPSISIAISSSRRAQGTCEKGLEVCRSLEDKGKSYLTHPGGPFCPLPWPAFPEWMFPICPHKSFPTRSEKVSQIYHAERGKMSQITLPVPSSSLALEKKSFGYMVIGFLSQVVSLFHLHLKFLELKEEWLMITWLRKTGECFW